MSQTTLRPFCRAWTQEGEATKWVEPNSHKSRYSELDIACKSKLRFRLILFCFFQYICSALWEHKSAFGQYWSGRILMSYLPPTPSSVSTNACLYIAKISKVLFLKCYLAIPATMQYVLYIMQIPSTELESISMLCPSLQKPSLKIRTANAICWNHCGSTF